jgi:hypothetical protein
MGNLGLVAIQISVAFSGFRPLKGMITRISTSESFVGLPQHEN